MNNIPDSNDEGRSTACAPQESCLGKTCRDSGEYLLKSSLIYLEGKITTRQWEDKDSNTRYTTEILANTIRMLGGKGEISSG